MSESGSTSASSPALSAAATSMPQSVFASLQGAIAARRQAGETLVPLHIGDSYLKPPVDVTAELGRQGDTLRRYGAPAGLVELRQELAKNHRARGLTTAQGIDNVHVGCGCTHALSCAVRATLNAGDEVLVVTPYWPLIVGVLRSNGVVGVEVPLTHLLYENPDVDIAAALLARCTPRTRAVYFITPNNPDGHMFSRGQLQAIADVARAQDLWVFADEVYSEFGYEREHISIANLEGMSERTVTSYSLSKSRAIAGARIGYVVASPCVIEATRRMANYSLYNVPDAMQHVALHALRNYPDWAQQAARLYCVARDAVAAQLRDAQVEFRLPHGGTFFFLDLSTALRGRTIEQILARAIEEGVLLAPGRAFGLAHSTSLRLCFSGAPVEQLLDGTQRFLVALNSDL